jgi:hypothetical protein
MRTTVIEIDIHDWILNVKTMLANNEPQRFLANRIIDQMPILVIDSLIPLYEDLIWQMNQRAFPDIVPGSYESVAFTTLWTLLKNYLHIQLATYDRNIVKILPHSIVDDKLKCTVSDVNHAFIQLRSLGYRG